jgi:peptidyl-dipeptidase Dcp
MSSTTPSATGSANPLLAAWNTPYEMPPFDVVKFEHFAPAFDAALQAAEADIDRIIADPAPATFANTILPLELSGHTLDRVSSVFFNLTGTDTTPELQSLQREIAPKLTAFHVRMAQNPALFARVDAIMQARKTLGLSAEQVKVLERHHRGFVSAGARLNATDKARLKAIAERQSVLTTAFMQNVLKDEQDWQLLLNGPADLVGLSQTQIDAARETAIRLGHKDKYAITLSRSSIEPFLQYASRRDLREVAYKAWIARGANGGDTDNRKGLAEMVQLRAEGAHLLGFKSYAEASLEFTMAKTPAAVKGLLSDVWTPARARALAECDMLQAQASAEGENFKIAAWDWRYYAEKVRKAKYDLDEAAVKPYLALDQMIQASFDCATRLFGLTFEEKQGLPVYNSEVHVFEVKRGDRHVGLFLADYFARPSKRSGAWMSGFRDQHKLKDTAKGGQRPIVVNVLNFNKAPAGQPTLLSMDDARTLFHEFGHALHGLLSDVTYPTISGTSVSRDFVELPSQLYENWLTHPDVLTKFARHYETGAPMPGAMLERLKAARTFNQGFHTVEYLSSAFADMALHERTTADALDVDAVESECLNGIGMPAEISMRHRLPHFQHIVGGYAAGYYSYMWSEVLDADAFQAFEDTGNIFDPETAKRLHDHIYSAGGRQDPADAYIAFRGRLPKVGALLAKRGLDSAA